jgi:fucose permease
LGRFLAGIVLKKLIWFYVIVGSLLLAALLVILAMPLAKIEAGANVKGWLDAPIAAYIFPLVGLLLAPVYPAINSVILSSLPKPKHGVMSGLIIIFSAVGGTCGSLITGFIFEKYDGQTAFYFTLVPIAILIISLSFFKRLQKKPVAGTIQTGTIH